VGEKARIKSDDSLQWRPMCGPKKNRFGLEHEEKLSESLNETGKLKRSGGDHHRSSLFISVEQVQGLILFLQYNTFNNYNICTEYRVLCTYF
jgi:hypothetical protein